MRWIQNTALFGLLGGSAMMLFGMGQGNAALTLMGAAFGLLVGVPAAYLHFFTMDGLSWSTIKARLMPRLLQIPLKRPSQSASPPAKPTPKAVVEKATAESVGVVDDEAPIMIPVRVERPLTPPPPLEPATPLQPTLSPEARQVIVDEIKAIHTSTALLAYLGHEDALVRLYAVQRLAELADSGVEDLLRQALSDEQVVVQRAARLALERLGYDDATLQSAHADN